MLTKTRRGKLDDLALIGFLRRDISALFATVALPRAILLLGLATLCSLPVSAQQQTADTEKVGTVHFAVSCLPATQEPFDHAVAMLHSFWYPPDLNAFTEITRTDPNCAMAYWGIAISRRANPLVGAPDPVVLKDGLAAVEKAREIDAKDPDQPAPYLRERPDLG